VTRRPAGRVSRRALSVLLLALAAWPALAADLPGWDKTHWGMRSAEIAALYGRRAVKLDGRIEFDRLYTDVALRQQPFAGLDFTVYFQMDEHSRRLAQVLLERRRQYATLEAWQAVAAALTEELGSASGNCDRAGDPAAGKPHIIDRVWALPTTTIHASYVDFGVGESAELSRRLLVRYARTSRDAGACPRSE
jgi:hypothetical protein